MGLTVIRGDTKTYNLTFKDSDGDPIDITGYTVFFTVKSKPDNQLDDASALISKTIENHTDPTNGVTQIALSPDDTNISSGNYLYDIQIKDAAGGIHTPSMYPDNFVIKADITRRTS